MPKSGAWQWRMIFSTRAQEMSPKECRKMVNDTANISLSHQCKILETSRSSLYYVPVEFSPETLELMRQIDRIFTRYPFFGSRQIAAYLPRKGYHAGRHRIRRLMKVMGLEAIYKRPNTRCPATHACMCERRQKAPREPDLSVSAWKYVSVVPPPPSAPCLDLRFRL